MTAIDHDARARPAFSINASLRDGRGGVVHRSAAAAQDDWQSGFPVVTKIADWPFLVWPRKVCGWAAERTASMAICTLPEVAFLKPTGQEMPDTSWRWTWLSVVRAPMAPQLTRPAIIAG